MGAKAEPHAVQVPLFTSVEYLPTPAPPPAQGVHVASPAGEQAMLTDVPGWHCVQLEQDAALVAVEKLVPAAQVEQTRSDVAVPLTDT